MADVNPPLLQPGQFFLKLAAYPGSPTSRYAGFYPRQHSKDENGIPVTPASPIYLRATLGPADRGVQFTSWAPQHEGRHWGLVLRRTQAAKAMWEKVDISEDADDASLKFVIAEDGLEVLEGDRDEGWRGWVAAFWSLGHPQLFWLTDAWKEELPEFCERVRIIRELPKTE